MQETIKTSEYTSLTLEQLREQQHRIAQKWSGLEPKPKTEAEIEYAKKLFADQEPDVLSILTKESAALKKDRLEIFQIADTYETAKFYVWEAYKKTLQVERGISKPEVTGGIKAVLQELTKWFFCIPGGVIPLDKGIYLWGEYGCGKTMLMKTFRLVLNTIQDIHPIPHRAFKIAYCKNIIEQYRESTRFDATPYHREIWCLDDLGYGAQEIKKWGNLVNPVEEILHERHKRLLDTGAVTLATSNLSFENCQALFDARVADRMYELFYPFQLSGKSFR